MFFQGAIIIASMDVLDAESYYEEYFTFKETDLLMINLISLAWFLLSIIEV